MCTCKLKQLSFFTGVIAYVDVRSGKGRCENRSKAVAKQLDNLGATVCKIEILVNHTIYMSVFSRLLKD